MKLLTLDRHTAPFFAPEFHSGAVEATFDVRGRIFEARVARDVRGTTRVVMQAKDNPRLGTFMAEQDRYLTRQLQSAQTLENYACAHSHKLPVHVERMCFFEPTRCMIVLSERSKSYGWGTSNARLIEMTNHSTGEVDFDFDSQSLPAKLARFQRQDFFSWSAEENESILRHLTHQQSQLKSILALLRMDDEAKSNHFFGCDLETLGRFRAHLRMGLIIEVTQGSLKEHGDAVWYYWVKSHHALETGVQRFYGWEETAFLRKWKSHYSEKLKIKLRPLKIALPPDVRGTSTPRNTGTQQILERWLASTAIEVGALTAHEILEANLQLREFKRAYPT